ncbi:rhodanese-related sulfurtransferase [Prosthecobacter fusiformis]|uniref:Rhodanese-related sulfurtransferase n=1 Tax=Prosthecobacter fusiformis TaxID=48464 RepID=A0A4R7S6Q6_9BACT|nr:rhodanese-like domain-containing protein [Prosthecobacter fusiformis]TDU72887.1 rhodanese-related sulfurtransferase [Prosthecobacter fusiformis]
MRLLLPLLCLALFGCKPVPATQVETEPPSIALPAGVQELGPAEAAAWMAQTPDAFILDLRMPEEIEREGKLTGSQNYDYLQPATQEYLATLDRQKPVLVYCALGGRSKLAAVEMHRMGFTRLALLKGGLDAWLKEGRPVVK